MRVLMEELLTDRPGAGDGAVGEAQPGGKSAASWPSIIAGAFVAAGSSLILLTLGTGLGFAGVAPPPGRALAAAAITTTAIWLIVTQWIAAALGGYIAGRLRTRWIGTHAHEVFFRDTAHGLVTWAVATVAAVALFGGSLSSLMGGVVRAATPMVARPIAAGTTDSPLGAGIDAAAAAYDMDKLFRPAALNAGPGDTGPGPGGSADARAEAAHMLANTVAGGNLPDADRTYLANLVVTRTGIPRSEAESRVADLITTLNQEAAQARETADADRQAAAQAAIYIALSLLVGAFIASVSAALGGRLRDEHP